MDHLQRWHIFNSAIVKRHETAASETAGNQTDFVKDRIAVEVQFSKYSFVAYDLFVKHMAFYIGDVIDVGVEILAVKSLHKEMASGVGYCTNRRSAVGESTL